MAKNKASLEEAFEANATRQRQKKLDKKFDLVGSVIAWENGEMDQEQEIEFFQHLVDTGLAWQFQGTYGRTAERLISDGLINPPLANWNKDYTRRAVDLIKKL